MQPLLLFYVWLWMTPEVWGASCKKDPPYFSSYDIDVIKNIESLWGRMVTICANGNLAFFVCDPLTQYKVHLFCAACGHLLS